MGTKRDRALRRLRLKAPLPIPPALPTLFQRAFAPTRTIASPIASRLTADQLRQRLELRHHHVAASIVTNKKTKSQMRPASGSAQFPNVLRELRPCNGGEHRGSAGESCTLSLPADTLTSAPACEPTPPEVLFFESCRTLTRSQIVGVRSRVRSLRPSGPSSGLSWQHKSTRV